MGLEKRGRVTYLKITEGKIRGKSEKGNPRAEERFVELTQKFVYEEVYTTCEGYLRDVVVAVHEEYGTSYNLILVDPNMEGGAVTFSLAMGEESRYFQSFVQLMPNLDFSIPMIVKPYKFKQDGKDSIGLSISQNGKKVSNWYKEWDEDTKTSTRKNGLEKFDFSAAKGDKDEQKILRIKLLKFLKEEFKKQLMRLKKHVEANPELVPDEIENETAVTDTVEEEAAAETAAEPATSKKTTARKATPPAKSTKKKGRKTPY